jgi:hypothetical protein
MEVFAGNNTKHLAFYVLKTDAEYLQTLFGTTVPLPKSKQTMLKPKTAKKLK